MQVHDCFEQAFARFMPWLGSGVVENDIAVARFSSPAMMRNKVVLPAPFLPVIRMHSWLAMLSAV